MRFPSLQDVVGFVKDMPVRAGEESQLILGWIQANPGLFAMLCSLALMPAMLWLWLFVRKGLMDATHRRFMILTFVVGMLSVPFVFLVHAAAQELFHVELQTIFTGVQHETLRRVLYFVVIVGMLEEYAKHVIVKELDYRRAFFNRIADGIEFSVAAALGFAFVENILYFLQAWETLPRGSFAGVVIVRSVGSMLAHMLFSGIFGYYYGRAKFLDDGMTPPHPSRRHLFHMHFVDGIQLRIERVKHMWQGNHLLTEAAHFIRREELIGEGLLMAMLLHGLYDIFLDMGKVYLIVPLIFLEFLFIWHELEVTENLTVHDLRRISRFRHAAKAKA